MTFREQLNKVNELGLKICDLVVANECDCVFDFDYTEQEFEKLCVMARECYLKSETVTANDIAYAINNLIQNKKKTIKQVLEMDKWQLIYKASCKF